VQPDTKCVKERNFFETWKILVTTPPRLESEKILGKHLLQFGNRMFEIAGPAEWNSLPELIRRPSSINILKSKLKTSLL